MEEEMRRIMVLSIITCMVLSGCGVRLSRAGQNTHTESSVGIFNVHTSFFDRYSMDRDEDTCKVKGTLHQAADDDYGALTFITAKDSGSVSVKGSMKCTRGSLRLVYTAPDGTETLIAEGTDKKIDAQVEVVEGEGSIGFANDGEGAVCDFGIKMKAGGSVKFESIMERDEIEEDLEDLEDVEQIERAADLEDGSLDEVIENNWPESIRYHSNGCWANPMSTRFEVDKPVTLSVSCVTRDGKLRLKIVRHSALGEIGETVYFDETNPDGEYTVELDKEGQYKLLFYAKEHVGSAVIMPVEE